MTSKKSGSVVCQGKRAIYAMIKFQSAFHAIATLCRALGVSQSGYYDWVSRKPSKRGQGNVALANDIINIFKTSRQTYGVPRMQKALKAEGKHHGRSRISKLMNKKGLKAKAAKRFKITTSSNHKKPVASNILKQNFNVNVPNQAWCTDITYIPTNEGWLYLVTVIDLYSRKIESFYHSLKVELIHEHKYQSRKEARKAIFDYIEVFYNRQRLHSTLGYVTPERFEMAA